MIENLITAVIENKENLSYVNLNSNNEYQGWVSDFNIIRPNGTKMYLDLNNENDLFLLFVLASAWSKTGPWENAAFFTTYLKENQKVKTDLWLDDLFVQSEIENREKNAKRIVKLCNGLTSRNKVSFRVDYFSSITILSKNWITIKEKLQESNLKNDYMIFIKYLASIDGLGSGQKRMRIKIPLILRELRCQKIFNNIPGEFCCVPDERVKESAKRIDLRLPTVNSLENLFRASAIIYCQFGDLYDIPLFAYEDLKLDDSYEFEKKNINLKNEKSSNFSSKWNGEIKVKDIVYYGVTILTNNDKSKTFSQNDIKNLLLGIFPDIKLNSIGCRIIQDCVNHTSRNHYPSGQQDFYFRVSNGIYRLYDPEKDGKWDWRGIQIDI